MGARDGKSYISRLKAHPRDVWIAGRKFGDVTTDPAFCRPVAAMARLYDCQSDPALFDDDLSARRRRTVGAAALWGKAAARFVRWSGRN